MTNYDSLTDYELLSLLRQSDENAFTAIYNRYWERLFFIAHKRLQSADGAKEIVQEIFLYIWQKREVLKIDSLLFYLAAMARYGVYRHLADEKRKEQLSQATYFSERNKIAQPIDFDNKQFLEVLTNLFNELPEKYRVVFIHHKLLDKPLEEVAEFLGVSPRTAERYVSEVMEVLRKHRRKLAIVTALLWIH